MLRRCHDLLDSGQLSSDELVERCLQRIEEAETGVKAWVEVKPREYNRSGPLAGIPFGIKDIFETRDMRTTYGAPAFAQHQGLADAALVRKLEELGGVLLGKTHTAAFSYYDAPPTRNPHDYLRTPGGSSSGSAAAVAAGMIPFAVGEQTQGSILRPASYCGVTGFKPTYGVLPLDGCMIFAPSLDTAGFFTQTAADCQSLWELLGYGRVQTTERVIAFPANLPFVEGEMAAAFAHALATLREAGWQVVPLMLPEDFEQLLPAVQFVNQYEGARSHLQHWLDYGPKIGEKLAGLVEEGMALPDEIYEEALALIARMRDELAAVFALYPVIATPAAIGVAPLGLESTGDPAMNAPWSGLGVPAISVPMPRPGRLPLGLQLVAAWHEDASLLDVARRVELSLYQKIAAVPGTRLLQ